VIRRVLQSNRNQDQDDKRTVMMMTIGLGSRSMEDSGSQRTCDV